MALRQWLRPQLKGLLYAHVGWFFTSNPSEPERWIPDLLADRDLNFISRTAAIWSLLSLAIPFVVGWVVTGRLAGAGLALLRGGVVRMAVLHHVTWGVNSVATCSVVAPSVPVTAASTCPSSQFLA